MTKVLLTASVLVLALALTACFPVDSGTPPGHGGGGGGDPYRQAWYDVYGNHCGDGKPRAGCNFYEDGRKITITEDPYYYSHFSGYYLGSWGYTDPYGYGRVYHGYAFLSPDGILYDENGQALNSPSEESGRDLVADVAAAEDRQALEAGRAFSLKYTLSEETGIRIARTLSDWATLSRRLRRARTDDDIADFCRRLYGVSAESAMAAISAARHGDPGPALDLNREIASYWGTTPETSAEVLRAWYRRAGQP